MAYRKYFPLSAHQIKSRATPGSSASHLRSAGCNLLASDLQRPSHKSSRIEGNATKLHNTTFRIPYQSELIWPMFRASRPFKCYEVTSRESRPSRITLDKYWQRSQLHPVVGKAATKFKLFILVMRISNHEES
jgi:hypothetical protein